MRMQVDGNIYLLHAMDYDKEAAESVKVSTVTHWTDIILQTVEGL